MARNKGEICRGFFCLASQHKRERHMNERHANYQGKQGKPGESGEPGRPGRQNMSGGQNRQDSRKLFYNCKTNGGVSGRHFALRKCIPGRHNSVLHCKTMNLTRITERIRFVNWPLFGTRRSTLKTCLHGGSHRATARLVSQFSLHFNCFPMSLFLQISLS